MVVKLATLAQQIFIPVFPCFQKRSIPTFFTQKVFTLRASFEEKMKKFGDDVFWNKAGYTATPVACGWAGAIIEVTPSFWQEQWGQKPQKKKKKNKTKQK